MQSTNKTSYIVYFILLAAHVGLVWLLPYFPSQDGPSHVYNLVILHDLLNGGREWGNYFSYQLHAVPNLGFNILAYPLMSFCSPLIVEKIFLSLYIVLMGVSVPVFLHAFERPVFPFAFCTVPLILNFTLLMGFYSCAIAVPLFLLACAIAWKMRDHSLLTKGLVYNLSAIVLFYVHLLPFIFYMSFLAAIVIGASGDKGGMALVRDLLTLFLSLSLVLLNLALYLAKGASGYRSDFSSIVPYPRIDKLIADFMLFSTVNFSFWQLLPALLFMAIIIICGYRPLKSLVSAWLRGMGISTGEKTLLLQAGSLTMMYLFFHGIYFNERFPWVILLTVLPLLRIPEQGFIHNHCTSTFVAVVTFLFLVTGGAMWQQSSKVKSFVNGLTYSFSRGALVMTYKRNRTEWSRIDVLMHAVSYYGIKAGCVDAGNYETGLYQFPVRFRNGRTALPHPKQIGYAPESLNWSKYPSIEYLIGWEISEDDSKNLEKFFHMVWEKGELSIWNRNVVGIL